MTIFQTMAPPGAKDDVVIDDRRIDGALAYGCGDLDWKMKKAMKLNADAQITA